MPPRRRPHETCRNRQIHGPTRVVVFFLGMHHVELPEHAARVLMDREVSRVVSKRNRPHRIPRRGVKSASLKIVASASQPGQHLKGNSDRHQHRPGPALPCREDNPPRRPLPGQEPHARRRHRRRRLRLGVSRTYLLKQSPTRSTLDSPAGNKQQGSRVE